MMNPHDDYEKLAKLLYPSIEASGNVYYGQTRKLMLDEIFKKNDIGFECYIKSYREDDINSAHEFKYTSEFSWKLGPLYGSIPFNPNMVDGPGDSLRYTFDNFPGVSEVELINFYEDEENCIIYPQSEDDGTDTDVKHLYKEYLDGIIFAKYLIEVDNTTINNRISSGNYNTYETSATAVFQNICCTDFFDPTNPSNRNVGDRQFYIKEDTDGKVYLYIQMCSDGVYLNVPAESYVPKPLTIKAAKGDFTIRLEAQYDTSVLDLEYDLNGCYSYSLNNGEWHEINSFHREEVWGYYWTVSDYISISENDTISFKGIWREIDSYSHYVSIGMYSNDDYPEVEASGRITSMYSGYDTASSADVPSIYAGLFEGCTYLTKAPKIPVTKYVRPYMFYKTFAYCTQLREMPLLLSNETNSHCYESMFADCAALRETSVMSFLPSSSFCDNMFSGCTQLNKVICYSYDPYEMFDYSEWLTNAASVGEFFTIDENGWTTGAGGIPFGWSVYEEPSYKREMRYSILLMSGNDVGNEVMSVGTDSTNNGRGYISDESTIYSMESSFDENGAHTMGTFNDDGSYNQDIWGYKSFNSPVQFRNGIYGECTSLTTFMDDQAHCGTRLKVNSIGDTSYHNYDFYYSGGIKGLPSPSYSNISYHGSSDNVNYNLPIGSVVQLSLKKSLYDDSRKTPLTIKNTGVSTAYICISSEEGGNLSVADFEYKSPSSTTWNTYYPLGTDLQRYIPIAPDNSIQLRGNHVYSNNGHIFITIVNDGDFSSVGSKLELSGNINSLLRKEDFDGILELVPYGSNVFKSLFKNCGEYLLSASKLILPAAVLSDYCYEYMFYNCTNLKDAPKLPALFLMTGCYEGMFFGCESLTLSPSLPANDLKERCYAGIFNGCTSLKSVTFPAKYIKLNSYANALKDCDSLSTIYIGAYQDLGGLSGCFNNEASAILYTLPHSTIDYSLIIPSSYRLYDNYDYADPISAVVEPLCFTNVGESEASIGLECKSGSSYSYSGQYIEYSHNLTTWNSYSSFQMINLKKGECIYFKGRLNNVTSNFKMTGKILASGSISNLLWSNEETFCVDSNIFAGLFKDCTGLVKAPKLPATQLYSYAYYEMFKNCTSLVEPPELPATILGDSCYREMFYGCTALIRSPELPANILKDNCYREMFSGCTSLSAVSPFNKYTIGSASSCFQNMFSDCFNLKYIQFNDFIVDTDNYGGVYRGMVLNYDIDDPSTSYSSNCVIGIVNNSPTPISAMHWDNIGTEYAIEISLNDSEFTSGTRIVNGDIVYVGCYLSTNGHTSSNFDYWSCQLPPEQVGGICIASCNEIGDDVNKQLSLLDSSYKFRILNNVSVESNTSHITVLATRVE